MNLFSFIDKYGCYTFEEFDFTEVDNVIFAMLSYLDLKNFVSRNKYNPKKVKEVACEFFEGYDQKVNRPLAVRKAIKILRDIKDTRRYSNLLLYNYIYDISNDNQFGALTIEINKYLVYVSFEGTDCLISGWKEDFMFSYEFPTLSQKKAIDYLNKNFLFRRKKIIVGGHSKGGNLAVVAGMYANFIVKERIINVYNNDGPGLLDDQFSSKSFKYIESKIIHIIPEYSIVGLLLNHGDKMRVIKSFKKSILCHDATTWVVRNSEFDKVELSTFSKFWDIQIDNWLKRYSLEERQLLVEAMFNVFERLEIESFIELVDNKRMVIQVINEAKKIDDELAKMLKSFIKVILDVFADSTKEELLMFFEKRVSKKRSY